MPERLEPCETHWINPKCPVPFQFEGVSYSGYEGDVLASALWANGVRFHGRSFKYHRARGAYSMAGHDISLMVEDGRHTNLRGDQLLIRPGLNIQAVNTLGGLEKDWYRVTEWFSKLLPVGFYYKAFYTPKWLFPFYEKQMREVAGLGRVNHNDKIEKTPKDYADCDLLVVGAGPSGMAAACTAAEHDLSVMLIDENPHPGGSLGWQNPMYDPSRNARSEYIHRLKGAPNLEFRAGTQVAGVYADQWVALVDNRRLTKLRTRAMVLATGCFEQPAVFQNNDLPGVMLGSAAQRLMHHYAVKPAEVAVVLAANSDGYQLVLDLIEAGVQIACLVDLRRDGEPTDLDQRVREREVRVLVGYGIDEAVPQRGNKAIRGASICPLDDRGNLDRKTIIRCDCDTILVSVGWVPNAGLIYQAGGRFEYESKLEQLLPSTLPDNVFVSGRANGVYSVPDKVIDGQRAALSAVRYLGKYDGPIPGSIEHAGSPPTHPYPIFSHPNKKNFVDFDEDIHLDDFKNAHQEGYDNVELLKRFTTVGMGPTQGKLSNFNAVRILAKLNGQSINQTGTTTSRPFYNPVPLGHLAGRRFHPVSRTAIHEWHVRNQAQMMYAGASRRPEFYHQEDKTREEAILGEAVCVRHHVGLIDVSTLGKIYVQGPDAASFLEKIYAGRYAKQSVGKLRYGIACDETGVIIEDGIVVRLAEDRYYVTATSSGASAFFRSLQRWAKVLQQDVTLVNATSQLGAMNLAGPASRELLQPLTDIDLSPTSFPFIGVREGNVAGVSAILARVGFVGELGYEIHVPTSQALHVWEALMRQGKKFSIQPFGVEAQRLLRLEKGHLIVGYDTDSMTNPFEANVAWAIGKKKPFFVGQRSVEILRKQPLLRILVGIRFLKNDYPHWPEECHLIFKDGKSVGRITSLSRRSTLGYPIAMAFLHPDLAKSETRVEIRVAGDQNVVGEVVDMPFYDPDNQRQETTKKELL